MSNLLWKYYLEDNVEKFRQFLANTSHNPRYASKGHGGGTANSFGSVAASPGGFATSPKTVMKNRRVSGQAGNTSSTLSRAVLNSRDHVGLTVLHRASSATSENAISFALALIEHPAIDLYIQDTESGWTALHRALYFGNITIARAIVDRDRRDPNGPGSSTATRAGASVIKVKDHEGNSPFDVYNATIARRALLKAKEESEDGSQAEAESVTDGPELRGALAASIEGEELFVFGSNKNHSLGFGDGDDRQHPEKITLKRPDHLLFRFYREYLESVQTSNKHTQGLPFKPVPSSLDELPCLILNRPIIVQDVALSKLHSAVLTTDPESNLYICGFGPGGRLGTGDEVTRPTYVCIEEGGLAGKKVVTVALGQNHTLAVSSDGEIFSWGTSSHGQLGYSLPRPTLKEEEPVCATPRQIFGPLKRETIIGVAASAIHSVAYTSTSLFCWGRNEGQLGLIDSDSRSLAIQPIPRKVGASLFKAPISMVSAINAATICLLQNHTVCVFTNYGYNIVKFPLYQEFGNYHLPNVSFTMRYCGGSNHISSITAGGDTIAAVSSRGDLFTVNVRKLDSEPSSASTTNPSKIKSALSTPQRIWSLRKGHWDGIKSVGVSENGSVIICTQAGAVWRRVKRAKIKDAFTGTGDFNHKDFKFQRIPGLTKVAAVRSNTFGVYAAIRKDCDVTKNQILVAQRHLWADVEPLFSLRNFVASERSQIEPNETPRFWTPALPKDVSDPLKHAILTSPDIEADVSDHLLSQDEIINQYDLELQTSNSDVVIPAHGFILKARSPVLRKALAEFRLSGSSSMADLLVIKQTSSQLLPRVIFQGIDFITLVDLAIYLYTDRIIDVWQFTRHSPDMAFRYRQVRVELMKTAVYLKMGKLESAVRLMRESDKQMSFDMDLAIQDTTYFEDGDAIVELDGSEAVVHSTLMCQRCPFFESLFKGRAGGQWLAGRRQDNSKTIRIDLKHIDPQTFKLVLRYLYADVGPELFDSVVSGDVDEFSELVLDVMAVANELMLDRLSQICQQVLGRFVNTRNISQLLNAVAPCSITEFKDAGLEYMCLQLESMLENHLLDDLDLDLLFELDEVVRGNQLNCLPFAKSGRAELLLHERHPSLSGDIDEERQRRIRDMTFRAILKDDDHRLSPSYRARVGSVDDLISGSPSQEKAQRKSKATRNAPFSPNIRPKDSTVDLMFDMDDDDALAPGSPQLPVFGLTSSLKPNAATSIPIPWDEEESQRNAGDETSSIPSRSAVSSFQQDNETSPLATGTKTWSSPALPSSKLDMREIMAQASMSRTSNLSMRLSVQKAQDEASKTPSPQKLSQKERKKQQQQILQQAVAKPQITMSKANKPSSPWQIAGTGPKTSPKEFSRESEPSSSPAPSRTLNLPNPSRSPQPRRTTSPDTRFSGQQRTLSSAVKQRTPSPNPSNHPAAKSDSIVPHSKSYIAPASKAEPSLQLSMADIIGQQRREQEVIKEAVAKRSLQEIQEEQAFQEWWDQESRRTQEEEASKAKGSSSSGATRGGRIGSARGRGGARGGRGDRGNATRGGGRGRGQESAASTRQ